MDAVIHRAARLGKDVTCGRFTVIEEDVTIGDGCQIGHGVVIHAGTRLGERVRVDDHAVIGKRPMRARASMTTSDQPLDPTTIGDDAIVGTGAIVYRGSALGRGVLVADLATVREKVKVGEYTIVGRGVAIEGPATIGTRVKLETNVYITAYSEIGDHVFVAPCVATSNDNFVGRTKERSKFYKGVVVKKGGRIGVHATVLPGKTIGADALVAAGALVTHDVPDGQVEAGVPARPFRPVPENQLLKNQ